MANNDKKNWIYNISKYAHKLQSDKDFSLHMSTMVNKEIEIFRHKAENTYEI